MIIIISAFGGGINGVPLVGIGDDADLADIGAHDAVTYLREIYNAGTAGFQVGRSAFGSTDDLRAVVCYGIQHFFPIAAAQDVDTHQSGAGV